VSPLVVTLFASYVLILLKAMQQLNVVGGHYKMVIPFSYGMAAMEVAIIVNVVAAGWAAVPWIGTGAAAGAVTGMWLHGRYIR